MAGWNTTAWNQEAAKPHTVGSKRFWFGRLSVGMRDANGEQYMRNRYYNPQTGQFTQPDLIGLATITPPMGVSVLYTNIPA